jgi:hypothetical protein
VSTSSAFINQTLDAILNGTIDNHVNNSQIDSATDLDDEKCYSHGSKVEYECEDKVDYLVGNKVRICQLGKWEGKIPRCGEFLNDHRVINKRMIQFMN